MKLKLAILCIGFLLSNSAVAQELNCQIDINYSQIQGSTNKQIFDQMKRVVFEFMNNTKWTSDQFTSSEKIECSFLIIVKEVVGTDEYSGSIQVISRRPVYNSGYYTQLVNIEDNEFQFKFQQFSQLEYNINSFQNNLTSVLQYYAYVVIAADYDSYSPLGGTPFWQKAQLIVQNAQGASEPGWRLSQKDSKNRNLLVENTLQPVFKGIRDCHYDYCRNGLDKMYESPDDARASILKSLDLLLPVYRTRPASFNMQVFFNAKRDEIINIFKGGTSEEKTKIIDLLQIIDPAGTTKYSKIQG
ncbi:MAG: DUF4835 family protein [bacterium]|nr:DUF4835 family protein [bacterium]